MKSVLLPSAKILLVDDNRDGLTVRKLLLEELGCQVEVAGCGEEALKLFSSSRFDVIVTDYRMPRMNGTELIGRIRALNPEARIILLSGFVEPLGLTEKSTGADIVLSKSAGEVGFLIRSVRRLLSRQPPRKPAESEHLQNTKKASTAG